MARWEPNPRGRLEQAALALYAERGYDETTVAEIAERAGLTERTFFRHFADKREVLFGGATMLQDRIVDGVAGSRFEGRRDDLRVRRDIIRSDDGLRERELRKRAVVSEAIRAGFVARGLDPVRAALVAETGVTLLFVSLEEWLDQDDDRTLVQVIEATLAALRTALAHRL